MKYQRLFESIYRASLDEGIADKVMRWGLNKFDRHRSEDWDGRGVCMDCGRLTRGDDDFCPKCWDDEEDQPKSPDFKFRK